MTDNIDELLSGLSAHDVDDWRKQRTRDRAQKMLARQRRCSTLSRTYSRYLEPALVGSLAMVYLAWAIQRVYFLII